MKLTRSCVLRRRAPVSAKAAVERNKLRAAIFSVLIIGSILAGHCFAQSGAVIPEGGAGHAGQASCIILKRMGPADQITSHLYSFGIRGKQFQYVEGKLPDGFPFHGRLTDHDVRNLQGRGAEVIVLNQDYTSQDLKEARDDCRGETGKSPNQAEPKAARPPTAAASAKTEAAPVPAQASSALAGAADQAAKEGAPASAAQGGNAAAETGSVTVKSTPDGADITADGWFVGNAPSTLKLPAGEHTISVAASGFKTWQRKIVVIAGSDVTLSATLEKE